MAELETFIWDEEHECMGEDERRELVGKRLALKPNLAILRNQQIANILVETCPMLFSPTPNILNDIGRCCQSYIHISSLCAHIF